MPGIDGLTNPFENSILNSNLTQLEKEKQLANYSNAISQGYEPPAEVLTEMAELLATGVLSPEAATRLEILTAEVMEAVGPLITSQAAITIFENTTSVITVTADDLYSLNGTGGLTYSIAGGIDSALFSIHETTGELIFNAPPDFEAPIGGDNIYDVTVQVNDGSLVTSTQAIQVTVADVVEVTSPATYGAVMTGIAENDYSGGFISSAGDVNGDGYDDMLISAYRSSSTAPYAGETYLVYGAASGIPANFDLSTLDGSNGIVMHGIDSFDFSGISVASAGDINGDGYDDVMIGAYGGDPNANSAGETYLVYGTASGLPASFDLGSLATGDGSTGFVMNGIAEGDQSGLSVASAGDVNGDGFDDMLIGAHVADPNGVLNAGETYLVYGAASSIPANFDLSTLNGSNGFVINGIDGNDRSGRSVSSAGDVNNDGYDDILIGASYADPNGVANAGETYLVYGAASGIPANLDLSTLDGSNGFVMNGIDTADLSGWNIASAGDVNADGYDDILIGAIFADPNGSVSGETYLVYGAASNIPANFDLSTLNGSNGFVMNGSAGGDVSGRDVASAGDVNGDGYDDMLIGAQGADPNGVINAGETYLVYGAAASTSASFDLSTLDGTNGFVFKGVASRDVSGIAVCSAGDVNGDGYDDIMIGAHSADPGGNFAAGETYLVYGGPDGEILDAFDSADGVQDGSIDLVHVTDEFVF